MVTVDPQRPVRLFVPRHWLIDADRIEIDDQGQRIPAESCANEEIHKVANEMLAFDLGTVRIDRLRNLYH